MINFSWLIYEIYSNLLVFTPPDLKNVHFYKWNEKCVFWTTNTIYVLFLKIVLFKLF